MDVLFDIPLAFMPRPCALCACVALLVALAWAGVVDVRTRMVPRGALVAGAAAWAVSFAASAVAYRAAFAWRVALAASVVGAALVAAFALAVDAALSRMTGRAALGMGDTKLLFLMGLHCGAATTLACLWAACALAALYSVARYVVVGAMRFLRASNAPPFDGTFPFVPFLAVSFVLVIGVLAGA